jgi:hypothetical protein
MGIAIRAIDGKVIGSIEGRTFHKVIRGYGHYLHHPLAIAIDKDAFDREILPSTGTIRVKDTASGNIYKIDTALFDKLKREFNRGFGAQYYVELECWCREGTQLSMFATSAGHSNGKE